MRDAEIGSYKHSNGLKKHTKRLNAPTPKSLESWCFCKLLSSCRLRALLDALMLILPMLFQHLHNRWTGPCQKIQNSYPIAMMEVLNGGKDLNVSVTMPAIEVLIISQLISFQKALNERIKSDVENS
uniref:Uncharacterized protein n=1 Tax=Tanacetum cinerariifolium TaxID=118510 RepID=A0A6L2N2D4_TANCI|nr:hypothetical protein [Tanacetum cinerariifolium]